MPKDDKNNNDLPYSGKSVGNYDDLGELDPEVFKKEDGIDPHEAGKVPKSFWQKAVEKGKQTIAGETTVGKVGAVVKNIAKNFVPYGDKIDAVTDAVGDNFKTKDSNMNLIKKAFSIQGAKDFFKWKDEDGNFSWEQVGISLLQVAVFVLLAYLDSKFGLGLLSAITGS